jgi:hypothetical protein
MADLRVLKLALLAETKDFVKGLDSAQKSSKTFSQKLGKAVKKAALAFVALGAAAGVAAIKIGVDAVKAAIEDEASQVKLAQALRNSTKATDAQIKSTERYITKAQNATGVTDIELRQALGNLVRATGDVTKAQELNNLALDIAAATGKDLNTITEALSKAYQGQTGALTRLDPSITAVIKSGGDADEIFTALGETFGGAAADAANTFAGRMEIIKRRVEDAQEALGFALLPVLEKVAKFISENVVPAIEGLVRGLTGKTNSVEASGIRTADGLDRFALGLDANDTAGFNLGTALRDLAGAFTDLFDDMDKGTAEGGSFAKFIQAIAKLVEDLTKLIDFLDRSVAAFQRFRDASAAAGAGINPGGTQASDLGVGGIGAIQKARQRRNRQNVNVRIVGNADPQGAGRQILRVLARTNSTIGRRALQ